RHVAADVDVGAEAGKRRVARLRHAEDRGGLGVADAKAQEVVGERRRQDDDVALLEAGGEAGGRPGERAAARGPSDRGAVSAGQVLVASKSVQWRHPCALLSPLSRKRRQVSSLTGVERNSFDESNCHY